jgi:GTPase
VTQQRVHAVGGSVGSGKSSLVAVLTHGVDGAPLLDDGKGKARTAVFRHKHEIQSGHTSSISQSMLGYDSNGDVLNYSGVSALTATEIAAAAQQVLHFIDLCGHSRFLRTALYGVLLSRRALVHAACCSARSLAHALLHAACCSFCAHAACCLCTLRHL